MTTWGPLSWLRCCSAQLARAADNTTCLQGSDTHAEVALGESAKYVEVAGEDLDHFAKMNKIEDKVEKESKEDPNFKDAFEKKRPSGSGPDFSSIYNTAQAKAEDIDTLAKNLQTKFAKKVKDLRAASHKLDQESLDSFTAFRGTDAFKDASKEGKAAADKQEAKAEAPTHK